MGRYAVSSEGTKCLDCGTLLPNDSKEAMYAHGATCKGATTDKETVSD